MKKIIGLFVTLLFLVFTGSVASADVLRLETGTFGTLGCGGAHRFRLSGAEFRNTVYNFRNFNSNTTITLRNFIIRDADGVLLAMLLTNAEFASVGAKKVLPPHESTRINTIDLFGTTPPAPGPRPFQVVVDWIADSQGLQLVGNTTANWRARKPSSGKLGELRSRSSGECVTLNVG